MLLTLDQRPKEDNQANISPGMSTHVVGRMQGRLPKDHNEGDFILSFGREVPAKILIGSTQVTSPAQNQELTNDWNPMSGPHML